MTTEPLISVCVPTYKRPGELREALRSILEQSFADFEILVGDDSPAVHEQVFQDLVDPRIRRFPHDPGLGQVGNVCSLVDAARGQFLVLLHDDDLLLPGALESMAAILRGHEDIDAVFGMQVPQDSEGPLRLDQVESFNRDFGRRLDRCGRVDPALAGLSRMFPNDGWMVRTDLVREVGYRGHSNHYPDFVFGVKLGLRARSFWLLPERTSTYRFTAVSVSTSGHRESGTWAFLRSLSVPGTAQDAHREMRGEFCRIEALNAALRRDPVNALRHWANPDFGSARWGWPGVKLLAACVLAYLPARLRPRRWR